VESYASYLNKQQQWMSKKGRKEKNSIQHFKQLKNITLLVLYEGIEATKLYKKKHYINQAQTFISMEKVGKSWVLEFPKPQHLCLF
jgi:hypothetical protein